MLGEGRGAVRHGRGVGQGVVEEHNEDVVWPARDIRSTKGGQGTGGAKLGGTGGAKPKRRFSCVNCQDNCCGLARELVKEAFKMGRVVMSPKVMILFVFFVGLILICRNSI